MDFEMVKTKSLQIAEALEQEIQLGRLAPGARVHSIRMLAGRFNVSIKVIQIVFDILEGKGLIERHIGRGTFVKGCVATEEIRIGYLFLPSRNIEESYHFQVFQGVCNVLQKQNFAFNLVSEVNLERLRQNYVGLIVSSMIPNEIIRAISNSGIPFAVYGKVSGLDGISEVYPDYYNGSVQAVDYLVDCGFRKIHFISFEQEENLRTLVCLDGYRHALEKHGLDASGCICPFPHVEELIRKIRQSNASERYAIYVPNDATAYDISNRLMRQGIDVPDKVSLVGFYNRVHSRYAKPPLTTVAFNHELLGRKTAEALIDRIGGKPPASQIIPVHIIERESVRIIRKELTCV